MTRGPLATLLLTLAACGPAISPAPPAEQLRDCRVPVFFRATSPPTRAPRVLFDAGPEFPLEDAGDGLWRALLDVPAGRHAYMIMVDGTPALDALNPHTWYPSSGDEERSMLVAPDCAQGALEVTSRQGQASQVDVTLQFQRARSGAAIARVEATLEGAPLQDVAWDADTGVVEVRAIDLPFGKYTFEIQGEDALGAAVEPARVTVWTQPEPFDWRDAVIYQVMVDRFRSSTEMMTPESGPSSFHGGDLEGITQAIEAGALEELGANVLWLSPVYDNPEGMFLGRDGFEAQAYHGYWPRAPREVEPRFGGAAALDRLITVAHARGVRVLLDIVLNHVHQEHPYAQTDDPVRWFNRPDGDCICGITCSWGLHMEECWFDPFMPDLQLRNPEVMDKMVADALWWLEQFDLDGLRLDAVPMMPRPVLRELRRKVRSRLEAGDHHVYLLGETYTQKGEQPVLRYYLGPDTLSGQFDFPVMWSLRDALAGRVPMRVLGAEADRSDEAWAGSGAVMAPILGNHDVPRFISDVNDDPVWSPRRIQPERPTTSRPYDLLRAAWTFVMAQPGAPVIYYGDEFGMPGANDPDNRRDMRFGDALNEEERRVRERVIALSRARACSTALRRGARKTLLASLSTYAHLRDAGDGFPAIVALNRGEDAASVSVTLPQDVEFSPLASFKALTNAPVIQEGRTLTLEVPARSGVLLLSQSDCVE